MNIKTIRSISNKEVFRILDDKQDKTYYGFDQEWYTTEWQRISGCGPTAASNIAHYIRNRKSSLGKDRECTHKGSCLSLMEEIWTYVTPTREGIKTTRMFCESFLAYADDKGISIEAKSCDMPKERSLRPKLSEIVKFLEEAFSNDLPVAFLNLCNGEETNLERWHWVTVISLEYEEIEQGVFLSIMDEGLIKRIDLALWYETTTLGGGFVYFLSAEETGGKS